jgi:hypothetical protein
MKAADSSTPDCQLRAQLLTVSCGLAIVIVHMCWIYFATAGDARERKNWHTVHLIVHMCCITQVHICVHHLLLLYLTKLINSHQLTQASNQVGKSRCLTLYALWGLLGQLCIRSVRNHQQLLGGNKLVIFEGFQVQGWL